MNADLLSKLIQVIKQIPKDALYGFLCSYAQSHEELAMALVSEFLLAEKDDGRGTGESRIRRLGGCLRELGYSERAEIVMSRPFSR